MNLTKYTLYNTLTYGLALFGPALIIIPLAKILGLGDVVTGVPVTIIFYCLGALLMLYYVKKFKGQLAIEHSTADTAKRNPIITGFIGIFILFAVQMIANSIEMQISGTIPTSANTENIMAVIQSNLLFTIVVSIAGPIMEELFFRRTLIGLLGNRFGFWIGAIFSSLLFFAAHADSHFILYFSMGLTLALLYRYTGKIWTSMIAHCGMNTLVILIQLVLVPLYSK